jgi:alpha-N-acetylglucosaminidase
VSQDFINNRKQLQLKILQRLRELGIEYILQGFYGMVPRSTKTRYPNAHVDFLNPWGGGIYVPPGYLHPDDKLFFEFSKAYYQSMFKNYGTIKYFGGDPFHESTFDFKPDFALIGKVTQQEQMKFNKDAVWVLQGWQLNPRQEMLNGIANKKQVLILDLNCENDPAWAMRDRYSGISFIWCALNNYGGRTGLMGKFPTSLENIKKCQQQCPNLRGIGTTMEGCKFNPLFFEFYYDIAWNPLPDLRTWLRSYTVYRYGREDARLMDAVQQFGETIYSVAFLAPTENDEPSSLICYDPKPSRDFFHYKPIKYD